jgi:serine/threonine-protein kinase
MPTSTPRPRRPSLHRPELPVAVDAVVACAIAKDPDQRYATAGALAEAARDALGPAAVMTIRGTSSVGPTAGRVAAPTATPVPGTEVPRSLGPTHAAPQPITLPETVGRRRSSSVLLAAGAVVLVVVAVAGIGLFTAGRSNPARKQRWRARVGTLNEQPPAATPARPASPDRSHFRMTRAASRSPRMGATHT